MQFIDIHIAVSPDFSISVYSDGIFHNEQSTITSNTLLITQHSQLLTLNCQLSTINSQLTQTVSIKLFWTLLKIKIPKASTTSMKTKL